jgi:hypothetical protein
MKILIVGCGAVGQVFGCFLQKAGVELALFDQPAMAGRLQQALEHGGLPVFQITRSHRKDPIPHRLDKYQVMADTADCRRFQPDQIWFAVPSPVYHSAWFREFLQQVPSRRVVCFAPEGGRPEFFPEGGSRDRLVFGGVTFMAWQGDLDGGGGRSEGVNFSLSPLAILLTGTKEAGGEVAALLKQAGLRAGVQSPDSRMQAAVTAGMTAFTAGLELAGWSLVGFRRSPWRGRAARAAREAVRSQLPRAGFFARTLVAFLCSKATFSLLALCLPLLFPFDIEKYLKFHYRKTRVQTLALLDLYAGDGKTLGLPVENIRILLKGLQDAA